jgi:hypothetical protein
MASIPFIHNRWGYKLKVNYKYVKKAAQLD